MADPSSRRVELLNLLCRWAALAWLVLVVGIAAVVRPNRQDFGQYYMGGAIAATGKWQALYPIPKENSTANPGTFDASIMREDYARIASERGVGDFNRFFQPPAAALLFYPLGVMSYAHAYVMWMALLIICGWLVACAAGKFFSLCAAEAGRWPGVITLASAVSPLMYRAIRTAQVSTIVGALLAWAVLALAGKRSAGGAVAVVVGAILKYITLVLLPLAVAMRRWTCVIYTVAALIALCAAAVAVEGAGPSKEFMTEIAPRLDRASPLFGNQSAYGMYLRVTHRETPTPSAKRAIGSVRWIALAIVLVLIFIQPQSNWQQPRNVLAAGGLLVMWMLIFSPLYWEHYAVYLIPFWGWAVAEGLESRFKSLLAAVGIALLYVPLAVMQHLPMREPLRSHMLFGTIALAAIAAGRLWKTREMNRISNSDRSAA